MIRFFRKIRHGLLRKNNFGKYLIYALGEIFLVVIGILIALQINNLNEGRKAKQLKSGYISRLISDIQKDSTDIMNNRKWIAETQKIIENTMGVLGHEILSKEDIKGMEAYFDKGWGTYTPSFNDNTYKDLSQTGNMNLFNNTEIRKSIMRYYAYIEEVRTFNSANNEGWVMPFDLKVTMATSALQFSQETKALFSGRDEQSAITSLLDNKSLLERSAAAHYWMNHSVLINLDFMENEGQTLLLTLRNALQDD